MRTRRLIVFSFIIIFSLSKTISFSQNLIAYYPFDNNVKDISGNNNNGIIYGDIKPAIDRFGNYCGALFFNGVNGYIEVPNSKSLTSISNKISVTCWLKLEKNQTHPLDKWLTLICKGQEIIETNNNPQYRVQIFQSDKQSTISVNTAFTEFDNNFNDHIIEYGKWYFYALVYDGNSIKTYFNGNKIWEYAYNGTFNNNNMPLNIGRDIPGALEFFCGSLDDLRIYNSGLSESEIIKLYNDNSASAFEEPFTLICSDNISVNTTKDNCFAIVNYKDPEFKINCGDASVKLIKGLPSGSSFPVGSTNITYKVESTVGRKKTCSFNILVKDNIPPVIKCPADVKLFVDSNSDFIRYDYTNPSASDACGIDDVMLISGLNSGDNFPVGNTENKFKIIDKNGNSSVCSFKVTVSRKSSNANSIITNNTPLTTNPSNTTIASPATNPFVLNNDSIKQVQALQDKIRQEELDKIKASKDQLIADKDKLATDKIKMNDSLIQMQEERDKAIAEKREIEIEKEKLELLKKQQEKQVLDLQRSIDSLAKVKQQITKGALTTQKYDLFNVPLMVGATALINNVYFVADASFLQIPSYAELDKLVSFLQKNNSLKVEIGGHTNGLCDDAFCNQLSTSRAKTCVDYLISKGINANRLNYKGYGKSQLLKPEAPSNSLNQRVEIKIIGI